MNDLAGFYSAASQYPKTETLYRKLLDIQAATTRRYPAFRACTLEALAGPDRWKQEVRSAGHRYGQCRCLGDIQLALAGDPRLQAEGLE
jgi:hypothetical protein